MRIWRDKLGTFLMVDRWSLKSQTNGEQDPTNGSRPFGTGDKPNAISARLTSSTIALTTPHAVKNANIFVDVDLTLVDANGRLLDGARVGLQRLKDKGC